MLRTNPEPGSTRSLFQRLTAWTCRNWRFGAIAGGGVVVGLVLFATWTSAIEYTNHTEFCITCHVMKETVYKEYTQTIHFKNKHGVHAGCPDCHVPQYDWIAEAQAKIGTVTELYAFFFGGMSNVANFEKERPELAKVVWAKFAANNARECRHCHDYSNMVFDEQKPSARVKHEDAMKTNENCIDCHKGIAHHNYEQKSEAPAPSSFELQ